MVVPGKDVQSAAIRPYEDTSVPGLAKRFYVVVAETGRRGCLAKKIKFFHAGGIDIDPAAMGAYPEITLSVLKEGGYRPLGKAAAVAGLVLVVEKAMGRWVEQVKSGIDTPGPKLSPAVHQQTPDHIIAQAAGKLVGMAPPGKGILKRVKKEETVILRAYPEITLAVFPDGGDDVVNRGCSRGLRVQGIEAGLGAYPEAAVFVGVETGDGEGIDGLKRAAVFSLKTSCRANIEMVFRVFGQAGDQVGNKVLITDEIIRFGDEPVEAVDGPYPKMMIFIFIDTFYKIIAEAGCVGRVVAPDHYFITVKPVEAIAGAKPDKPPAVLEDGFDGAVGQTLFVGKMGKPQPGRLALAL